ncbi:hypothetical protein [Bradyrhizobium sp.]|uniref:hypothetical protein n=1 Tax=Bradyrhizobium sp. TaxID=376 RepID=UPI003BAF59E2
MARGDIFATLDAGAFQLCFVAWVAALTNTPAEVIANVGTHKTRAPQILLICGASASSPL